MELESAIKERIQERFDILHELYDIWFTENPALIAPMERFYQQAHIEKHRAITYLLNKGFIAANPVENEPELVAVCITVDGIDFFEQGRLAGKGNGWSVATEYSDE
ncbi:MULTISPECIES: hypothetical protein [Paenibacillus]|uniref:Uncharacterized protein n=1 Tax=Paenibacillus xylanilyticus TaxID=248903 RepID=A0A7Y6EUS0_9BACL|nr:hypothetical protein [Paenibacillus xylanilyticus]NUU75038.1 hypothetical protein [Paenibacillus xylanilyticus]